MSGVALEIPSSRLERELAYYRREVNDLGAKLIRSQEEQQRCFFDAQRSRLVVKMVRELYAVGDRITGSSLPDFVLEIVVENAMCTCAALFREKQLGDGVFDLASMVGLPPIERSSSLKLRQTPPFVFTTASTVAEPAGSEIANFLGAPYILWTYDKASGYALALGNRSEANVSRPFELADQELIETALTVFLDAQFRNSRMVVEFEEGRSVNLNEDAEPYGVEGGDTLRQQLRRGGRVTGVLVVERPNADGCEYVAYLNVTWRWGWHVLRAYRNRGDRTYRHLNSLLQMIRSDLEFMAPVTIYAIDSAELERVPAIAAYERRLYDRASGSLGNKTAAQPDRQGGDYI